MKLFVEQMNAKYILLTLTMKNMYNAKQKSGRNSSLNATPSEMFAI